MSEKKRILIIGSGGAGKSTFAVKLGKKTGLPVVHLDSLYWIGNWEHRSKEEFDELLEKELAKSEWILDGNFNRTLPRRLEFADFVIFLDFHPVVCALGVIRRVIRFHGVSRPDMGPGCPERFDPAFLKWVLTFRKRFRKTYLSMLSGSGKEYVVVKSRKELGLFLDLFHQ